MGWNKQEKEPKEANAQGDVDFLLAIFNSYASLQNSPTLIGHCKVSLHMPT